MTASCPKHRAASKALVCLVRHWEKIPVRANSYLPPVLYPAFSQQVLGWEVSGAFNGEAFPGLLVKRLPQLQQLLQGSPSCVYTCHKYISSHYGADTTNQILN